MEKKNPKFSIPDRYTTIRASPEIVKWLWERGARLQARYAHRVSMDLVLRDIRDEIEGNTWKGLNKIDDKKNVCPRCGTEIVLNEDESAALAAAVRNGESQTTIKCEGCGATISLAGLDSVQSEVYKLIDDFRDSFSKEFKIDFRF